MSYEDQTQPGEVFGIRVVEYFISSIVILVLVAVIAAWSQA